MNTAGIETVVESILLETHAPEETEALGARLGALLRAGSLVALYGDLAAGKTCLVRGIASALSDAELVNSPTFTLINEYAGRLPLHHLDLYRLTDPRELADIGVEELFDSDGICLVEWAERAGGLLPARRVEARLRHEGANRRSVEIANLSLLPAGWREALAG